MKYLQVHDRPLEHDVICVSTSFIVEQCGKVHAERPLS